MAEVEYELRWKPEDSAFAKVSAAEEYLDDAVKQAAISKHASRCGEGWADEEVTIYASANGQTRIFVVSAEIIDVEFDVVECPREGEGCDRE